MMMGFPNLNFLDGFNDSFNPFIEKMDKGELTLEDILKEDSIIQDIKTNNDSKFNKFFTSDKIKKLIDYSTKFPSQDEHNIGYKYPFNATEILCSDNTSFQNIFMEEKYSYNSNEDEKTVKKIENRKGFIFYLFSIINKNKNKKENKENKEQENDKDDYQEKEDENEKKEDKNEENITKEKNEEKSKVIYENVNYLLNFLKPSNRTSDNYVLVGYFYRILNNLINIHQMKLVQYLLDYPDITSLLINHMHRKSICNIIQKLLMYDDEMLSKLNEKKIDFFSEILIELDNTNDKNKYECICDCICSVINNRQFFDLIMTKYEFIIFYLVVKTIINIIQF